MKNSPALVKINGSIRTICQIEVEEIPTKVFSFKIIWFDPNVNSLLEKINRIREKYGDIVHAFSEMDKAVEFLNANKVLSFVISCCGNKEERFIDQMYGMNHVCKIFLYSFSNLDYYIRKWDRIGYEKLLHV